MQIFKTSLMVFLILSVFTLSAQNEVKSKNTLNNSAFFQNLMQMNLSEKQKDNYLKVITEQGNKIKKVMASAQYSNYYKQVNIQEIVSEQHQKIRGLLNKKQYRLYIDFFNEQINKAKQ